MNENFDKNASTASSSHVYSNQSINNSINSNNSIKKDNASTATTNAEPSLSVFESNQMYNEETIHKVIRKKIKKLFCYSFIFFK